MEDYDKLIKKEKRKQNIYFFFIGIGSTVIIITLFAVLMNLLN